MFHKRDFYIKFCDIHIQNNFHPMTKVNGFYFQRILLINRQLHYHSYEGKRIQSSWVQV